MEESRRLQCGQIPAFGEWNHHHDDDEDDWSVVTQRFESATRVPLPVHKPIKIRTRASRRRRIPAFGEWNNCGEIHGGWPTAQEPLNQVIRRDYDGVLAMGKRHKVKVRQSRVADSDAHAASELFSFTVVKDGDDDLYEVPPEMLFRKPTGKGRTRWLRSLLMRCFGLSCVCIA